MKLALPRSEPILCQHFIVNDNVNFMSIICISGPVFRGWISKNLRLKQRLVFFYFGSGRFCIPYIVLI